MTMKHSDAQDRAMFADVCRTATLHSDTYRRPEFYPATEHCYACVFVRAKYPEDGLRMISIHFKQRDGVEGYKAKICLMSLEGFGYFKSSYVFETVGGETPHDVYERGLSDSVKAVKSMNSDSDLTAEIDCADWCAFSVRAWARNVSDIFDLAEFLGDKARAAVCHLRTRTPLDKE